MVPVLVNAGSNKPILHMSLVAESLNRWNQTDPWSRFEFRSRARTQGRPLGMLVLHILCLSVFQASSTICPRYGSDRGVCLILEKFFQRGKKILFDGFASKNIFVISPSAVSFVSFVFILRSFLF